MGRVVVVVEAGFEGGGVCEWECERDDSVGGVSEMGG